MHQCLIFATLKEGEVKKIRINLQKNNNQKDN